jgi:hypothetical protein
MGLFWLVSQIHKFYKKRKAAAISLPRNSEPVQYSERTSEHSKTASSIQGGSDKSGIFFFFLLNGTAQLKIIRFY